MARGGKRAGAGRKAGVPNKTTSERRATLSDLAREHTDLALSVLAQVASGGESEAARVSAAIAILDRGYGKPSQAMTVGNLDGSPIGPQVIQIVAARPGDVEGDD